MKIAFMGSRGVPALYGGFETATEEIGARLAARGHDVTVYCRPGNGDPEEPLHRGMKKKYVPCMKKKSLETITHTFAALVHALFQDYDVLIVMNPANGPLCVIPRVRGLPFAVHVDGLDWERSRWPWIGRKFIRFGAWCSTKLAPALIADSHGIEDYYLQHWNRETVYASYGADVREAHDPRNLEQFGLTLRAYFLVVARLEPENHADFVLQAYQQLDTEIPLIVVGDSNYESDYIRRLKKQGGDRVQFIGGIYDRESLEALLHYSLLYIHGHSVGGTNPVLLQAMACSCATTYLDVKFNREVLGDTGKPFTLDDDTLVQTLTLAIGDPESLDESRSEANRRVQEKYTWEGATDAYESLCESLLHE
ncbi:MAG TPA: DUF1972 domain-containing protein [Candidatus Hydrogenedentes bacterium]|nr:DUF1972 domain-containing protein [Candidatus Hydrogenedentota bacterium]